MGFPKGCSPRRRGRPKIVIRIYRWRCTDRAIEPLARHDVRCAKGPSLLAISLIYSGICGQGKNADTPFATVNPEGQASSRAERLSKTETANQPNCDGQQHKHPSVGGIYLPGSRLISSRLLPNLKCRISRLLPDIENYLSS